MSAAGKRAGIKDGTRSGLWAVFAEAIDALRPQYVVIENVRGLLSAAAHRAGEDDEQSGDVESVAAVVGDGAGRPVLRAAGAVLGDLADLRYDAVWATVAAADVGAPHRRERVFIVASVADAKGDGWDGRPGDQLSVGAGDLRRVSRQGTTVVGDGGGLPAAVSGELLPTPVVTDAMGARNSTAWRSNPDHGISVGDTLTDAMWKLAADRGEMQLPTGPTRGGGDEPGVALLPTPRTSDTNGAGHHGDGGMDLRTTVTLFRTPNASDAQGQNGRPSRASHQPSVGDQVVNLLLPTPAAQDGNGGGRYSSEGHQSTLPVEARLLCTPSASDGAGGKTSRSGGRIDEPLLGGQAREMESSWGKYEPAIRRWERVLGRPAPDPTEPNKNGNPRLSAAFSEWLMGWPAGWVTDPDIGISRSDQLRIVGNGVCPQQAIAALRYLLAVC